MPDKKYAPIALGGGKYCYSGPNCTWHSATGAAKVRTDIKKARIALAEASTYEEHQAAMFRLAKTEQSYDATDEGLKYLQNAIKETQDPIQLANLEGRLEAGKIKAADADRAAKDYWASGKSDAEAKAAETAADQAVKDKKARADILSSLKSNTMGSNDVRKYAQSDDAELRAAAAKNSNLSTYMLSKLITDPDPKVVFAALSNSKTPTEAIKDAADAAPRRSEARKTLVAAYNQRKEAEKAQEKRTAAHAAYHASTYRGKYGKY